MENRLAIKGRNVILSTTWTNCRYVRLRERSQPGNVTYWMIPFIGHSKKAELSGQKTDQWLPRAGGEGMFYHLSVVVVT